MGFFKTLYTLGWKTALPQKDFLWASLRLMATMFALMILAAGCAFAVGYVQHLNPIAGYAVAAVLGIPLVVGFLAGLWLSLKLTANRVHDLGFKFRWLVVLWLGFGFAIPVMSLVMSMTQTLHITPFLITDMTVRICQLYIMYMLYFEKGPETVSYTRTEALHTVWTHWKTAAVAVMSLLVFGPTLVSLILTLILI